MADPYAAFADPVAKAQAGADPYAAFADAVPQINFNRPIEAVRADIGKLQGKSRDDALAKWADHFVANERASPWYSPGGVAMAVDNTIRTPARGSFVGPFLDEFTAGTQALQHKLGLGGSPYDEAVAYQRARDRAVDTDYPVASFVGKLVGGVAGGIGAARQVGVTTGGVLAGGPLAAVAPAATMGGRILQGAGIGGAYGAAAGAGNAEGDIGDRVEGAKTGAAIGAALGGVLPPAVAGISKAAGTVADAVSPTVARWSQGTRNVLEAAGVMPAKQRMASVGAAAASPDQTPPISGAEAAAEQMIANQLSRANVSTTDIRQRLAQSRMAGDGINTPSALVDADNSLARLGGTVARQQPEAGNRARGFIYGRQTGITPLEGMPNGSGIPTRPAFTPEVPGQQMGQYERVRDALRRAMGISDDGPHGFANTAYRTDNSIIDEAKREAKTLYDDVRKAGAGIDLQSTVAPVLQKWTARTIDEIEPVAQQINQFMGFVIRALGPGGQRSHIERLDKVKQWMDNQIDKTYRAGDGYAGGVYTELKNDILKAVDAVKVNDLGEIYAKARGAFSSRMEMREALQLGRDVFKENSEIVVDQFLKLTPGQEKLSRLGLLESFEQKMGRQKRTADITQTFETPRVQEILQAVIPKGSSPQQVGRMAQAYLGARPQQLGRMLQTEKGYIGTRNEVLGNSKSVERLADDQSFNQMAGLFEQLRSTKGITDAAFRVTQATLDKVFGFRADTAAEIARKLFTADRRELDQLLSRLEGRMGPNRAAHFRQLMQDHQAQLMLGAATATTQPPTQRGRQYPRSPSQPILPRPPTRPTQP